MQELSDALWLADSGFLADITGHLECVNRDPKGAKLTDKPFGSSCYFFKGTWHKNSPIPHISHCCDRASQFFHQKMSMRNAVSHLLFLCHFRNVTEYCKNSILAFQHQKVDEPVADAARLKLLSHPYMVGYLLQKNAGIA